MHPSQYRNGSSLLPIRWVYPGRRSTAEIWHHVELPDVEATHRTTGIRANGSAGELCESRGFDLGCDLTGWLLALMTKRVGVTLRLQRLNAVVRSSSGPGQFMLWEIAR